MKISQLNSAVRDHEGLVKVRVKMDENRTAIFEVTKRSLLQWLKDNFDRGEETGLFINSEGNLSRE